MALLIQQRVERPGADERPSARRAFSAAAVCVDCVVCGSARSQVLCSAEEMAAQRRYLTAFYRRRWRAQRPRRPLDARSLTCATCNRQGGR